ncbi:MAG: type II secretion system inner membrane protein GspF [Pseudomonadota bacterium]
MAAYEYIALDSGGKQKKGILEADSVRQIRQLLRDQGLTPLSVDAAAEGKTAKDGGGSFSFGQRRLNGLDLAMFTRQLSTLLTASLPLEEALAACAQQSEKRHVTALVMAVRSKVLEGFSLAAAFGEFPTSFNMLYRSTVAAGEQSGFLDRVLNNLADYTEKRFESRRDVEMALFYPVIILCLALLIVGGLVTYIVPEMVRVFENMGQDLPVMTQVLIATSDFLRGWWWALFLFIWLAVIVVRWALSQPAIRQKFDARVLRLPLIGRVARSGNASRYASTLSILTQSGVPLVEAMTIAADVVTNTVLRRRLRQATQRVSEGSSLRAALETVGYFPPMFLHMVASGEASGELDSMLSRVADYQQTELERVVNTVVKLFEPMMLLFMGGLVMIIVMAILLPILNMNSLV